jgi:predicted Zn-dependent protease
MKKLITVFFVIFLFFGCVTNPLSGKSTMAFMSNRTLFPMAFQQYSEFLNENTVITNTAEADMVARVGEKIANAAMQWLAAEGYPEYLDDYRWEYNLVSDKAVNAWCMPGGKIVVYTGILPVTETETGLAVVMGHEVSHALLNHGQQRMSANVLQQLGAVTLSIFTDSDLAMAAYGIGSTLLGTLPFSREHESEADRYGLILMAIAGYDPSEAVPFWERMAAMGGGGTLEFLSTHPSSSTRIRQLREWTPEAKQRAASFGIEF